MKKDLNERRYLFFWTFIIFFVVLVVLGIAIFISFDVIHNKTKLSDEIARGFLFTFSIFLIFYIIHKSICFISNYINKRYLKRFDVLPQWNCYKESKQKIFKSKIKPYKCAVLLFHGYSASNDEFRCLMPKLDEEDIVYIAPEFQGFGLTNTVLLEKISYRDWFRRAVESYEIAAELAEKVSIIGHSMGAIVACHVANYKPIEHLIMSGPGLYSTKSDRFYEGLFSKIPILSPLFCYLMPMIPKPIRANRKSMSDTLDPAALGRIFQVLSFPVHSLTQAFKAQRAIDLAQLNIKEMHILHGKHDVTVDLKCLFEKLKQQNISFSQYELANTAHNCFEDTDKLRACQIVMDILQNKVVQQ